MSRHTITAEIETQFHLSGAPDDEREVAYPKIEVTFDFKKGCPAVMYQRNGDPGWPAEPHELEFIDANLLTGDGLNPTQQQIDEWAKDWLDDAGYEQACELAQAVMIGDDR